MRDSRLVQSVTLSGGTTVNSKWVPLGTESSTANGNWINGFVGNAQGAPSVVQPFQVEIHYPNSTVSGTTPSVTAKIQTTVDDGTTTVDGPVVHAAFTAVAGTERTQRIFYVPPRGLKGIRVQFTLGSADANLGTGAVSVGYAVGDERSGEVD